MLATNAIHANSMWSLLGRSATHDPSSGMPHPVCHHDAAVVHHVARLHRPTLLPLDLPLSFPPFPLPFSSLDFPSRQGGVGGVSVGAGVRTARLGAAVDDAADASSPLSPTRISPQAARDSFPRDRAAICCFHRHVAARVVVGRAIVFRMVKVRQERSHTCMVTTRVV